jgi:hypothetical protein
MRFLALEGQMSICLGRREFLGGLGGAATWPLAARAQQQPTRMRRIGVFSNLAADDPQTQDSVGRSYKACRNLAG